MRFPEKTLNDFILQGPSTKALRDAKNNLTGGFARRIDSNAAIENYVGMMAFYHLPLNYLDTFKKKILAVTKEQIQQAFKKRLKAEYFVTIQVDEWSEVLWYNLTDKR